MHDLNRRCVNIEQDDYAGIEKRKLSSEIEKQTAEFLARGRQIYTAPPSQYDREARLGTTINIDREIERANRMALIPVSLREPKNESGCKGVVRDQLEWVARWRNVKVGKFDSIDAAIDGLLGYLKSIGYTPE